MPSIKYLTCDTERVHYLLKSDEVKVPSKKNVLLECKISCLI